VLDLPVQNDHHEHFEPDDEVQRDGAADERA